LEETKKPEIKTEIASPEPTEEAKTEAEEKIEITTEKLR